jgi:hypothetical protein
MYSMTWAQGLKQVFGIEIEMCGSTVTIDAHIKDPEVIEKILKRLGLDEVSYIKIQLGYEVAFF